MISMKFEKILSLFDCPLLDRISHFPLQLYVTIFFECRLVTEMMGKRVMLPILYQTEISKKGERKSWGVRRDFREERGRKDSQNIYLSSYFNISQDYQKRIFRSLLMTGNDFRSKKVASASSFSLPLNLTILFLPTPNKRVMTSFQNIKSIDLNIERTMHHTFF